MEKTKLGVEVDIQGSEGKSNRSSALGLDSEPDYTLIGSSSPTHTEDRWVETFIFVIWMYSEV